MSKKAKLLVPAGVLALALFFGPSTSEASARDRGPRVAFHGHFGLPHGSVSVYANNGRYGHRPSYRFYHRPYYRSYNRPYYNSYYRSSYYRPYVRPYRLVRVYVYYPFPHWAIRRVYDPYYDPY